MLQLQHRVLAMLRTSTVISARLRVVRYSIAVTSNALSEMEVTVLFCRCPGAPGDGDNPPRCLESNHAQECGLTLAGATPTAPPVDLTTNPNSLTCKSQCTENACPLYATCTDDPNSRDMNRPDALCECRSCPDEMSVADCRDHKNYRAVQDSSSGLTTTCIPVPDQGDLFNIASWPCLAKFVI